MTRCLPQVKILMASTIFTVKIWQWKKSNWQWKMSLTVKNVNWQWKMLFRQFSLSMIFFTVNDIFHCQLTFFTVNDILTVIWHLLTKIKTKLYFIMKELKFIEYWSCIKNQHDLVRRVWLNSSLPWTEKWLGAELLTSNYFN